MDARSEPDVADGLAADVEPVRILEAARVPVGGGEEQQDLFVRLYGGSRDRDLACRGAEERLHRRAPTYALLERRAGQRRVVAEEFPLLRVGGQATQGLLQRHHRSVHPGGQ